MQTLHLCGTAGWTLQCHGSSSSCSCCSSGSACVTGRATLLAHESQHAAAGAVTVSVCVCVQADAAKPSPGLEYTFARKAAAFDANRWVGNSSSSGGGGRCGSGGRLAAAACCRLSAFDCGAWHPVPCHAAAGDGRRWGRLEEALRHCVMLCCAEVSTMPCCAGGTLRTSGSWQGETPSQHG